MFFFIMQHGSHANAIIFLSKKCMKEIKPRLELQSMQMLSKYKHEAIYPNWNQVLWDDGVCQEDAHQSWASLVAPTCRLLF